MFNFVSVFMSNKKLTKDIQIYIVQQLAMYEKPQVVVGLVKEFFNKEISLNAVIYYRGDNPDLPTEWKDLFDLTRKNFLETVSDIPIANKSFRLRELDRLYHNQKNSKLENPIEARATLEQAAKESGDAFTNKRIIDLNDVRDLPDEELLAIVNSKG